MHPDILFIVGSDSAFNDNLPLRLALRSLEKHASGYARVIVAGEIPPWLSTRAMHIHFRQNKAVGKAWNIMRNIVNAVFAANMKKPFLLSSDDHYFCRDFKNLADWPHFAKTDHILSPHEVKAAGMTYGDFQKCLYETRLLLEQHGLPIRRYSVHLNSWIDPEDLLAASTLAESVPPDKRPFYGYETTCLAGNIHAARTKNIGENHLLYHHDAKVSSMFSLFKKLSNRSIYQFSTTPKAERSRQVMTSLLSLFPNQSSFESMPLERNAIDLYTE